MKLILGLFIGLMQIVLFVLIYDSFKTYWETHHSVTRLFDIAWGYAIRLSFYYFCFIAFICSFVIILKGYLNRKYFLFALYIILILPVFLMYSSYPYKSLLVLASDSIGFFIPLAIYFYFEKIIELRRNHKQKT